MRHTVKKVLLLLLVALLSFGSLTGCHGRKAQNREEFNVPMEFDATKEYNITFWAKNDTNITQSNIYKKAISDFEAIYPNIHINLKTYTDYALIYQDVITNIATDTTPNVCISYPDHIATYMKGNNVVVNLDGLIADKGYGLGGEKLLFDGPAKEEIVPKFLEECKIGASYYALPYMRSTEALYINKDLVDKLGYEIPEIVTWDYIWEVSEAAMKQNADGTYVVNGQTTLIPFIYKSTDNMMISMLKQKHADYSDANGNVLLFNDVTKELLYSIAPHAKSKAFSTFKISSYPGNYLNAGQCIFAIDSTAGATWMGTDAPNSDICSDDIRKFETVIRPIPQFDTAEPYMISQGPSLCIFNKEDEGEVMASWLFMQYLLTNEVQISYSQTEGYIPVTTKAQTTAEYQSYLAAEGTDNDLHYKVKIQASKLFLNNIDHTFVTPVFAGSASVREAAGELIENVTRSVRRKKTVDDAFLEQLFKDTAALKHLDQITVTESDASAGGAIARKEFGKLPTTSVLLLTALCVTWLVLIVIFVWNKRKEALSR
ncbi:MAG: extracellular solute-binding protein [Lachnospiraceae bacterium]|nr:extracellular solute-binding protein [Lachnospiraceae bacterium]